MKLIFGGSIPSVLLIFLVLASAQRSSHSIRDVDFHELERQNKITKQILEAFIQKKLGLRNNSFRTPSIFDILPVKMKTEDRNVRQSVVREDFRKKQELEEELQDENQEDSQEDSQEDNQEENLEDNQEAIQEYPEDSLQSVESEQVASIYDTEGMYSSSN